MLSVKVLMATALAVLVAAAVMQSANAQSGEADQCSYSCKRESKTRDFGFGVNINVPLDEINVIVDVGTCTGSYVEENGCTVPSGDECAEQCVATESDIESHSNRDGPFSIRTIQECAASKSHCEACAIKPTYETAFPGSEYEKRVEVGKCSGEPCATSGHSCVPVQKGAISVEGPNGNITVDTVEKCECAFSACYKRDYFESYTELLSDGTTQERLINVGQCIGECTGILLPGECFPSPDDCQLRLPERRSFCAPTSATTHTFNNLDGEEVKVNAILACGCTSG